jgi:hypothetical protein
VECRRETGDHHTHNEKTSKVYFVKIFGVKKEVGDAEILAEAPGSHSKENDPAEQQHLVTLQVV